MKKVISLILALALVMSLSVTAFAAENTATNDGKDNTTITVNGTYAPGGDASSEVVSVGISWDAMTFTYTGEGKGAWNPAEHNYGTVAGGWSEETATITVTNHSNVAVTATLGFTATVEGIEGTFTESSGTANDKVLELATAVDTLKDNAPTASAEFGISGAAISESKELGTITVSIATVKTNQ